MAEIQTLSDELGVSSNDRRLSVTLWDMRHETPERREYINSQEMVDLVVWYLEGHCPACLGPMLPGKVICQSCFGDAQRVRGGKS